MSEANEVISRERETRHERAGERVSRERREGRSGEHYRPLVELTLVRIREFTREKEAVFWVFVFPVLLACALGIAFRNTGPEKVRVAIEAAPGASAPAVAQAAAALAQSPGVEVLTLSPEESARALRGGKVSLVVVATGAVAGSNSQTANPATNSTQPGGLGQLDFAYRYDPTRPDNRAARLEVDAALARAAGQPDIVAARDEQITASGARYIDFLVPGLIGLNLMGSGMWGIGFSIVTARGRKLLKRFAATPMRRTDYLLSFVLSRLVFLCLEVAAVLVFAWLVFGVRVHGSIIGVALVALLGGMTFSGLGLLVAARPTTIEGVSGLMNFIMLPMWLLSGTFFSSERFPAVIQPFVKALPLTAVNDALRALVNDGAPLMAQWPQVLILAAWALLSFVIALRIFRWQ